MEQPFEPIPDILPELAHASASDWVWVDVRTESEFYGPMGHVPGALHVPLGMALMQFLEDADPDKAYIFVCAHGFRSAKAAGLAREKGLSQVKNLKGGTEAWIQHNLPVVHEAPGACHPTP